MSRERAASSATTIHTARIILPNGMRLDRALHQRGLARSRTEARELIAAGLVTIGGKCAAKASETVPEGAEIVVHGACRTYVSRGGLKLQAALDAFGVPVAGRVALDVGASTGGFTDCLLQRGIAAVTAIDVGHGQMAARILADPRVTLREGVNARNLTPADFDAPFDIIVVDVSFISLRLIIPAIAPLLADSGDMICLVKPQFEVGADALGKGGVVRSDSARTEAITAVVETGKVHGLVELGRIPSPITGGDGNMEYLLWMRRAGSGDTGIESLKSAKGGTR